MNIIIKFLLLFPLFLFFNHCNLIAQSLTGSSGLITIPTAEIAHDGEILFGANFINKKYNVQFPDQYHQYSYFITLGFMPFLETSLRLTRPYNYPNPNLLGIGDRMPSVRLQFLKEKQYLPALLIGAHDFMWAFGGTNAINYNALYLVATKHYLLNLKWFPLETAYHLGYGTDIMEAEHHQFVGLFSGFSLDFQKTVTLMIEYDAEKFNGGIKFNLFNHMQFLFALLNFNSFSGGVSLYFILPKKVK
jgi:hypothetical protein